MNQDKNREFWAGTFLLLGLALIAGLIILFGEIPDLFKPTYTITVKFPNAAGLLKGSDVYLSGAKIGRVITDPHPIPDSEQVDVKLKIDKNVGIRQNAGYEIGSSGLLGDKFVEVHPVDYKKDDPDRAPFIKDGDVIDGTAENGLPQLMEGAKPLIDRANDIAAQLDDMITRLNKDVLPATSTDDLKETIAKLRHMVDSGDVMITNANSMILNVNDLINEAKNGHGIVGRLINDRQTGDNFRDLVENLKVHGILFYHDDSAGSDDKKRK